MPTNKTLIWIAAVVAGALTVTVAAYVALDRYSRTLDALMKDTLVHVAHVESYSQDVTTEVAFPDRTLSIVGTYHIDRKARNYASFSTSTLKIAELGEHTFSVENLSLQDTIYTRISTESPLLTTTIPQTNGWKSFPNTAIPKDLENIALPGPTLDNLLLFGENGRFIQLQEKMGEEEVHGERLHRYEFSLSEVFPEHPGPVRALTERIGAAGRITVWVDATSAMIRHIRFENDTYSSETMISNVDTPLAIPAPLIAP
ncbi:MAG: hypothetical protein KBE09_04525 [Candidatus Pacebacteria bacterium]|nr:hypothetical protein [Candidatus Paceibacterota bacterium]